MVKSFNLDRHWQDVGSQVTDLANQHLTNGICQRGELTQQLEQRIANATGKKYCKTYGSGTAALTQGLRNLKLPSNTEVLVPAYTFLASASAVSLAGLRPVFVDVDDFYHIDLDDAASKISNNTRVLLYVSLLGSPARTDIGQWCADKGLILVEDAAQSFGAPLSNAVFSMISFSPTKPCTSFGSGGAIVTNCLGIARNAELGRLHGKRKNDDVTATLGVNSVMSTHEVAGVYVNLNLLEEHAQRRREISIEYIRELAGIVEFAKYRKGTTYSKFVIQHPNRDAMPGTVHYGLLPPEEAIYNIELPANCARLQMLSKTLPNCAYMTDAEVESIIKAVKAVA
jgi:UDP-2-acetamido-2-deoxy-ribo-hexuluronate aminotransferase